MCVCNIERITQQFQNSPNSSAVFFLYYLQQGVRLQAPTESYISCYFTYLHHFIYTLPVYHLFLS